MANSQLPTMVPLSTKTTSAPLLLKSTHIPACNSSWPLVKSLRRIFIKSNTDLFQEPDSSANLVTNLNVAKCANAESAYKTLVTYAIEKLNLPNVAMYLDAGHAGWLGWTGNITPAARLFGTLYANAGKPAAVRGLATNVANYDAWSISTCPSYPSGHSNATRRDTSMLWHLCSQPMAF